MIKKFNMMKMIKEIAENYQRDILSINTNYDEKLPIFLEGDVYNIKNLLEYELNEFLLKIDCDHLYIDVSVLNQKVNHCQVQIKIGNYHKKINTERLVESVVLNESYVKVTRYEADGKNTMTVIEMVLATTHLKTINKMAIESIDRLKVLGEQKLTVLIVEDNENNQIVIGEILKSFGIEVDYACNGQEALNQIHSNQYHLIFMDIHMPVMDGISATKEIRKLHDKNSLPIIGLSADIHGFLKEEALRVGMNEFMRKPFTKERMSEKINTYYDLKLVSAKSADNEKEVCLTEKTIVNLKGVNTSVGLLYHNNNIDLYKQMLVKYYKNYSNFELDFMNALEKNDLEWIILQLHTFRGLSHGLGVQRLSAITQTLEISLKNGFVNTMLARRLFDELDRVLNELSSFVLENSDRKI